MNLEPESGVGMSSSRKEIWYLITSLTVGGAERTLIELANNIDHDEFSVTVWTLLDEGSLSSELSSEVTVRTLNVKGKWDVPAMIRFAYELRKEQPAILQSFLYFDNLVARLTGTVAPKTRVISGVRQVPKTQSTHRKLLDYITIPLSDYFVSNSVAGAEFVNERGAPTEKISVIQNGRNLTEYSNGSAPNSFREAHGIPSDAQLVGTVGRLVERKGQYDLLDAWPNVRSRYPNAHLLLVGDGPERAGLEQYARKLGYTNSIHIVGRRDDIPDILDLLTVFVFPSHYEGLPGAVQEAMAAGLPIVVTPVDGSKELITDRETGLYAPIRNPDELADKIVTLLTDRELAATLGSNAQQKAFNLYTIETMVSDFTQLYDRIHI